MTSTTNVPTHFAAPRRTRWEAILSSGFVDGTAAAAPVPHPGWGRSRWQNVLASDFVERRQDAHAFG
ncbi:MAG: hypothetical protein QOH97_1722 [Actinoplanes sp.]|jgi:hypothetical protein|nr:hypothetical protein [Actinoplanes sp.]